MECFDKMATANTKVTKLERKIDRRGSHEDYRGSVFSDSRKDVQSKAAILHAAMGVRLYRLIDLAIDTGLTRAAWPAWNPVLSGLRRSSEQMKQCALFRLPRVYRLGVAWVVGLAVLADTVILAAKTGRMLALAETHSNWWSHAVLGLVLGLFINLLVVYFVSVLMKGLRMMERSIGSEALDMPGLSYVMSTAETGLRLALASATNDINLPESTGFLAMNVMSWVDRDVFQDDYDDPISFCARRSATNERRSTTPDGRHTLIGAEASVTTAPAVPVSTRMSDMAVAVPSAESRKSVGFATGSPDSLRTSDASASAALAAASLVEENANPFGRQSSVDALSS